MYIYNKIYSTPPINKNIVNYKYNFKKEKKYKMCLIPLKRL